MYRDAQKHTMRRQIEREANGDAVGEDTGIPLGSEPHLEYAVEIVTRLPSRS